MLRHGRWVVTCLSVLVLMAWSGAPLALMQGSKHARIDAPVAGVSITGTVDVRGRAVTADPSQFSFYRLYYGSGTSPGSLRPIGSPGDRPVEDGLLGVWDTSSLFQGEYTLLLMVYDTSGLTTTAEVVVNVLPVPTPTSLSLPSVRVPTPEGTPATSEDDADIYATPLPVIPPLVPQIPQIDTSQPDTGLPVQPIQPGSTDPGFQPIQINPGPAVPAPGPYAPSAPGSGGLPPPPLDYGAPVPPAYNPISPVGPPPPPVVAPYVPPPTFAPPAIPTPTIFGLP